MAEAVKAPAKKRASAKPKATAVDAEAPEVEVAGVPAIEEVIQEIEADAKVAEAKVEEEYAALKDKTVEELRQLHVDALLAEAQAKTELYNLRQRIANLGTDVQREVDVEIRAAMTKVEEAGKWIKAIEAKLAGELKDIWGTYF